MSHLSVLIAEDELTHFTALDRLLREVSPHEVQVEVTRAKNAYEAIDFYKKKRKGGASYDAIFVDLVKFPPEDAGGGSIVVQKIFETEKHEPLTKVILMSAWDPDYEKADGVLQLGIVNDFLEKPLIGKKIRFRVRRIIEKILLERYLRQQVEILKADVDSKFRLIGSLRNNDFYKRVKKLALENRSPVLLRGESGTGKEVIAREIHRLSERRRNLFIPVNCAAVPKELFEGQFFGYEPGAFSGARKQHQGYFEQSQGGTIFLDEIGDVPVDLQVKLLRIIEEGTVTRLSGTGPIKVDVRLIAATNIDLEAAMSKGLFRSDLFFRLDVMGLEIPPLCSRRADIEPIALDFLERYRRAVPSCRAESISHKALKQLEAYHWPGNVRQLQNAIQYACLCEGTEIQPEDLPVWVRETTETSSIGTIGWMFTGDGIHKEMSIDREIAKFQLMVIRHAKQKNWKASDIQNVLGVANLSQHITSRFKRHLNELETEVPDLVEYFAQSRDAIRKLR